VITLAGNARLDSLEPWQAEEFAAFVQAHRSHLAPWLPWATMITDAGTARSFLQRYADRRAEDSGRIYGIWDGDDLVGGTLFRVFDAAAGTCEIGVWLAPTAQGRGLVTAAAGFLIDWAVRVRGLHRVEWRTVPTNTRSIATAKRLGLTLDGTLREAFPYNGIRHDIQVWSLLATDAGSVLQPGQ
jgi:ribosomal-protein-serine acetyltransferase